MIMEYKSLFAIAEDLLLATLKGEPVNATSLNNALLSVNIAIDNASVLGEPVNELESMRSELLTIRKAVWYADRGE